MIPEKELIRNEYIIRDMQLLGEVKLTKKGLIRYLCLSLGLINPNETRTLIFDIIEALIFFHYKEINPDIHQIIQKINQIRSEENKPQANIKAIRYHLFELKKLGILTKKDGKYFFALPSQLESKDLGMALEQIYLENTKNAFEKIKKVLKILQNQI
jgi:hypothetical protein